MPTSDRKTLKVLLSVYACEPGRGSEPGVGWNMAVEIAKKHQVWAFTSNTHRALIEEELAIRPIPNLSFIYFDPFNWVYDWSGEGKKAQWNVHLHYYLWQIWAYFVAKRLHQKIHFDLVHHVTYVRYSSPSFLSLLPIPFVWGPVGGGESMPKTFWQQLRPKAKLYEFLREQIRRAGELDPFVHLTARRSKIAWATTEDTAQCLNRVGANNVQILSQIGLNDREIATLSGYQTSRQHPVRFISIGRLLHWKGFHLGLQAFAQADLPADSEYWIVGEGAELESLQELAKKLDIATQVKFWHKLSREETLKRLGECLALVHPSLHDSGGLVCLEAMAAGCPVICLDLGGPGILVTPETGFKIVATDPERTVGDLAKAMTRLSQDIELRNAMGKAGHERVCAVFSWKNKAENLDRIYRSLVVQNAIASTLAAKQQGEVL
ncbi:MAG: glycosyltransferase [Hydrococcus sp. Prado102]|jgi:glycosyltransferase involved in cell wall biosynthesis|nr:glycosyltransferase [Hydrococcus sp. Prado102]